MSHESTTTALGVVPLCFAVPLRIIVYDNACNLVRSISLNLLKIMQQSYILCDRSHYKSRVCSLLGDLDSWPTMDGVSTSGTESLNSTWATARGYIRFLNFASLVTCLFAKGRFPNIYAQIRDRETRLYVEDVEIARYGNEVPPYLGPIVLTIT